MKLYEMSKELAIINNEIITEAGDISPDLEVRLNELQIAFAEKTHGIRKWVAQLDGDGTSLDREIARLENLKRLRNNLRERLMEYIKVNMETAGLTKIDTPIGGFAIQKNPPSVVVDQPDRLPAEYRRVVVVDPREEIDKKKIKEDIEAGKVVPGATIIRKTRIVIK